MDPDAATVPVPPVVTITSAAPPVLTGQTAPLLCSYCHQPILPTYYFCPNCGNKIFSAPLSTSAGTQAWIYAFSIVLPVMCFIFITRWPALKYYRSADQKAKSIGITAIALLTLSTLVTIWFAYVWTEDAIQSSIASVNADMSI